MSKIFEDGKVYKFSKKKCMKDCEYIRTNCWIEDCKGKNSG